MSDLEPTLESTFKPQPRNPIATEPDQRDFLCLVNLVYLDPPKNGGTSRVVGEVSKLILHYARLNHRFYPVFVVGESFAEQFEAWLSQPSGEPPIVFPYQKVGATHRLLRALKPDLIVSPLFGGGPLISMPEFSGIPHVVAMPDALALDKPDLFSSSVLRSRQADYTSLKQASIVVTLSEYSRRRLLAHVDLPADQVMAIGLGADVVSPKPGFELSPVVSKPYVYYPANAWPHKRHHLLLKIMAEVWKQRPDLNLVLTGGRALESGIQLGDLIARHNAPADRVHDLQFVSDDQVAALYANAEAMLFVSEHEGFGMPILEAMSLGCPVICAPVTAIPEVGGDAVLYVDSADPQAWADALLNQLPPQREQLIQKGYERAALFTWQHMRNQWRDVLVSMGLPLSDGPALHPSRPPTVALDTVLRALREAPRTPTPALSDDVEQHFTKIDHWLNQETDSRWSRVAGVGLVYRWFNRLRTLRRILNANKQLAQSAMQRQRELEARIDQLRDSTRS